MGRAGDGLGLLRGSTKPRAPVAPAQSACGRRRTRSQRMSKSSAWAAAGRTRPTQTNRRCNGTQSYIHYYMDARLVAACCYGFMLLVGCSGHPTVGCTHASYSIGITQTNKNEKKKELNEICCRRICPVVLVLITHCP